MQAARGCDPISMWGAARPSVHDTDARGATTSGWWDLGDRQRLTSDFDRLPPDDQCSERR